MNFTATCHPTETHAEPVTFTEFDTFKSHAQTCRKGSGVLRRHELAYKGKPVASTRYRPFTPELGEVGSWVTMSDGTTGQVWSTIKGGASARVWVATGTEYRDESVRHLSPAADPAEQLTITPEPSPEPAPSPEPIKAPEPVLQAAIDSGHAVIVPVGFSAPEPSPEVACVGFADCPCQRCRAQRYAASEAHPDHSSTDAGMCEPCQRAAREAHVSELPEPSPEPVKPKRMAPSERKAWNRAVADLAREHDAYREAMAAWDAFTAQRLAGVSPEDAYAAVMGSDATVTPIRSA